jgi:hypothetical protein
MFNVTNEANWWTSRRTLVNSDGSINSSFGDLNNVGEPRNWQFGAKFRF